MSRKGQTRLDRIGNLGEFSDAQPTFAAGLGDGSVEFGGGAEQRDRIFRNTAVAGGAACFRGDDRRRNGGGDGFEFLAICIWAGA